MIVHTIYKALNTITGKVYIGFDSKWPNRQIVHKSASKKQDYKFYRAIRKYEWDNFQWSILYQSQDKDHTLKVMENYFINEYDSFHNGYNSTLGGDGTLGRKHTLEERLNQSISTKEKPRPQTPEHIKKRIDSLKKNPDAFKTMLGKKHSDESKLKMSLAQKGIKKSETHKSKMAYQILNKTLIECPHCHKTGQYVNMKRWHFDKCKFLVPHRTEIFSKKP
jgi:group I intron endonuclease